MERQGLKSRCDRYNRMELILLGEEVFVEVTFDGLKTLNYPLSYSLSNHQLLFR